MIVKGKDVIGLKIVTIDTGTVLDTVDDIAFSPTTHRVEALLVNSGGIFKKAKAIHINDVHNIGENAVIVPTADAIKTIDDLDETVHSIADSNKHLVKTNVLTVDGKELGKVTDIFFDSATGYVESMEVTQGGLKTITEGKKSIKPADIITIGADATIVSAYTELKLEEQGEEGGLKGALNDAKEKAGEVAASVQQTAQEATEKVKDISQDVAENVKEKSADAQVKARQLAKESKLRARDLKDVADTKATEAKYKINELADEANERMQDVKDKHVSEGGTIRRKGNQVVEQSKQIYEDALERVEIEKTKIKK